MLSKRKLKFLLSIFSIVIVGLLSCYYYFFPQQEANTAVCENCTVKIEDTLTIPEYSGNDYIVINDNIPEFSEDELKLTPSYQHYSDLDSLGRSGEAIVCINKEDMPEYERGSIGMIHPSGWHTFNTKNKWGIVLPDNSFYLFNRCHIIGFQLTGIDGEHTPESLLEKNLFTGTRYMNIGEMLNIENTVAWYLRDNPDEYIIYKVTPIYNGDDLVPYVVQMQALSSDNTININEAVYNIQKVDEGSILIDYSTGVASYY